jgi:predicted dehydrogenase
MTTQKRTIHTPRLDDLNNPFNQHLQFLKAIRAGRPPLVPLAAGLHDLNVVRAVYESARTNQVINL